MADYHMPSSPRPRAAQRRQGPGLLLLVATTTTLLATLWTGPCLAADTPAAAPAPTPAQTKAEAMRLLEEGNALSFPITDANCTRGLPALRKADELFEGSNTFVQLRIAQCDIVQKRYAAAARTLRALIDSPPHSLLNNARRALAPLLAQGLGVAQDRERALGLYLMSSLEDHERRAAAKLLAQMPGTSLQTYYNLLEQGHLPTNWLMAVQTRQQRNENRYSIIRRALQGVIDSTSYTTPLDSEEQQSLSHLREIAGTGLVHWGESDRLAVGWSLLRQADNPSAEKELQALEPQWPFTLLNPDGHPWQNQPPQGEQ